MGDPFGSFFLGGGGESSGGAIVLLPPTVKRAELINFSRPKRMSIASSVGRGEAQKARNEYHRSL